MYEVAYEPIAYFALKSVMWQLEQLNEELPRMLAHPEDAGYGDVLSAAEDIHNVLAALADDHVSFDKVVGPVLNGCDDVLEDARLLFDRYSEASREELSQLAPRLYQVATAIHALGSAKEYTGASEVTVNE